MNRGTVFLNKLINVLVLLFWSIPAVIAIVGIFSGTGVIFGTILFLGAYTLLFLLDIPYLIILFLTLLFQKRNGKLKRPYLIVLAFNIIVILITVIALSACLADYYCSTSDAPLGSAGGLIIVFLLSHLFWTLPTSSLMWRLIKYKNKT